MELPLQVTIKDFPNSPALTDLIEKKSIMLDKFGRLTRCAVVVNFVKNHPHHGKEYCVRINLTTPGRELAVTRVHNKDVYVALRDAFDGAKRKLASYWRRRRT